MWIGRNRRFAENFIFRFLIENWLKRISGWSGSKQIPEFHIMLYNVVYTGAIPIIVGLLEQNIGSKVLLDNPIFYNRSSNNELYNKTNLFLVILDSYKFSFDLK